MHNYLIKINQKYLLLLNGKSTVLTSQSALSSDAISAVFLVIAVAIFDWFSSLLSVFSHLGCLAHNDIVHRTWGLTHLSTQGLSKIVHRAAHWAMRCPRLNIITQTRFTVYACIE